LQSARLTADRIREANRPARRHRLSRLDYADPIYRWKMFLTIGAVLLVLWLLGFILLKKTVGGIIHILLVIAIIVLCIHFLRGG
jgi:hypothetical protein